MSPEQLKIQELERQVKQLTDFMRSFENKSQLAPNVQRTIQQVVGNTLLNNLSDVVITSPSNGEVLKYDSGTSTWINATDETA